MSANRKRIGRIDVHTLYDYWILLMYTVYCIPMYPPQFIPYLQIPSPMMPHDHPPILPRHHMKIWRAAAAGGIPAASSSFALQADMRLMNKTPAKWCCSRFPAGRSFAYIDRKWMKMIDGEMLIYSGNFPASHVQVPQGHVCRKPLAFVGRWAPTVQRDWIAWRNWWKSCRIFQTAPHGSCVAKLQPIRAGKGSRHEENPGETLGLQILNEPALSLCSLLARKENSKAGTDWQLQ